MRIARRGLLAMSALALSGGAAKAATVAAAIHPASGPAPPPTSAPAKVEVLLWPTGAIETPPKGLSERSAGGLVGVTAPRLEIFRPPPHLDRGRAMLVVPGGGYERLVLDNEGYGMARFLNEHGITAGVLVYRLPGEGWKAGPEAPLQDAVRGMRLMRSLAPGWKVDPERIGVVGFSSGGHLAGMLTTRSPAHAYAPIDAVDALPTHPAFAGLIYPVIDLATTSDRMASRHSLFGETASAEQIAAWSVEKFVTPATPPCFLVHAADDPIVPPENSLIMYRALIQAKAHAELHLFGHGGHGFGLVANATATAWPDLFLKWAEAHGLGKEGLIEESRAARAVPA